LVNTEIGWLDKSLVIDQISNYKLSISRLNKNKKNLKIMSRIAKFTIRRAYLP
jgi:hypothetical protein